MKDKEWIIKQTDASMRLEGMPLIDQDKDRIRSCVGDQENVEYVIGELVDSYRKSVSAKDISNIRK